MDGSFFNASATIWGATARPHSTLISVTCTPKVLQIFPHRSPNLPPLMTSALSPGERKLATAPSIPPVPDDARMSTSFLVWYNHLRSSRTSPNNWANSGARWWMIGLAIASNTSGGTGVGPGASKYRFNIGSVLLPTPVRTTINEGRYATTGSPPCQGNSAC